MTERWRKFESSGRFGLSSIPCFAEFDPDGGDLGSGASQKIMAFESAEAREYFLRADNAEHDAKGARRELRSFKESLAACFTKSGRIRRKRLIELAEKVKGAT